MDVLALQSPSPPPHKVQSFEDADADARRKQYQKVSSPSKTLEFPMDPLPPTNAKDPVAAPFEGPDQVPADAKALPIY